MSFFQVAYGAVNQYEDPEVMPMTTGNKPLEVAVAPRLSGLAVDVFIDKKWVGIVSIHYPAPNASWAGAWFPEDCRLKSTVYCRQCKGSPCSRAVHFTACNSPELALGLIIEQEDPDAVVNFSAIKWPENIRKGIVPKTDTTRPTKIWEDPEAPVEVPRVRERIKANEIPVAPKAAKPTAPKKKEKITIEDAMERAMQDIKESMR